MKLRPNERSKGEGRGKEEEGKGRGGKGKTETGTSQTTVLCLTRTVRKVLVPDIEEKKKRPSES